MTTRKKTHYPREWNKETIQIILQDLDFHFTKKKKNIEVVVIGGVAIVLQEYQDRATNDFDLAPVSDAGYFLRACEQLGIDAQAITMSTTVDFNDVERIELFRGKSLTVFSVTSEDLIRLKLERFRKQDPEDIYAIIEKERLPYESFAKLVEEGSVIYIGRKENYLTSAQVVVETIYPDRVEDFKRTFRA